MIRGKERRKIPISSAFFPCKTAFNHVNFLHHIATSLLYDICVAFTWKNMIN